MPNKKRKLIASFRVEVGRSGQLKSAAMSRLMGPHTAARMRLRTEPADDQSLTPSYRPRQQTPPTALYACLRPTFSLKSSLLPPRTVAALGPLGEIGNSARLVPFALFCHTPARQELFVRPLGLLELAAAPSLRLLFWLPRAEPVPRHKVTLAYAAVRTPRLRPKFRLMRRLSSLSKRQNVAIRHGRPSRPRRPLLLGRLATLTVRLRMRVEVDHVRPSLSRPSILRRLLTKVEIDA